MQKATCCSIIYYSKSLQNKQTVLSQELAQESANCYPGAQSSCQVFAQPSSSEWLTLLQGQREEVRGKRKEPKEEEEAEGREGGEEKKKEVRITAMG